MLVFLVSESLLRLLSANLVPGLFRRSLFDLLSSGEATLISWETITVFHAYGLCAFAVTSYVCLIIKQYRFRAFEFVACPYTHVQNAIRSLKKPEIEMIQRKLIKLARFILRLTTSRIEEAS